MCERKHPLSEGMGCVRFKHWYENMMHSGYKKTLRGNRFAKAALAIAVLLMGVSERAIGQVVEATSNKEIGIQSASDCADVDAFVKGFFQLRIPNSLTVDLSAIVFDVT